MPKENPSPKPGKSGQINRLQIGLNVFVQVIVVLALVLMINFIGFREFKRWDFSRNKKFALSSMTKGLLTSLPKQVKAVILFSPSSPISADINQLLREYEFASKKKFEVEIVDPYNNIQRAKELAAKYKFGNNENILILDYQGRTKFVPADAMAVFDRVDPVSAMAGQTPKLRAFKGEQAITSALLEITEEKQNKVYVISGHGEPELQSPDLLTFKSNVERQNIKLESLRLGETDKIPEDATGLMIFGPRADFSEREMKLLSEFWAKKGRLFILLNPEGHTTRLDSFLLGNGIAPTNDRVLRTATRPGRDENQQITSTPVVLISPIGEITAKGKEISKDLAGMRTGLIGLTESLQIDHSRAKAENLRIAPLIESDKAFWGETEYNGKDMPYFDPKKDHQGPMTLAAGLEKGALADSAVKVDTSRMIVVGNATWLTDDGLKEVQLGLDFALNSLNWLLNREQLIGIPPKVKEPIHLDLDEDKLSQLALVVTILIPGVVAIFGFGVWVVRRS